MIPWAWLLPILLVSPVLGASLDSGTCPKCEPRYCNLPNCRCTDANNVLPPASMQDKPQIVLLTYDDAVLTYHYNEFITKIFTEGRKNPNGCGIGGTFYVCHEYTNYQIVHELWRQGIEIALHSITHKASTDYWKTMNVTMWEREFIGMRELISHFANIPEEDITGIRVPFLQIGGDRTYQMLKDNGLNYDCSIPSTDMLFPYTLDYKMEQRCNLPPCPEECHTGVWTVPMNELTDLQGAQCAMLDGCPHRPETKEDMLKLLNDNFNKHYNGDRTPFGIFLHIALLQGYPHIMEAYTEFIDTQLSTHDDVYFLNTQQLIDWMQNPVSKDEAKDFEPWKKQCTTQPKDCQPDKAICELDHKVEWGVMKMYMEQCGSCPNVYPWIGNPLGE